ncbi:hypothetical protein [Methylobacterium nodulans]|nr:hypothetical protein [Methylobacterium nodulans]
MPCALPLPASPHPRRMVAGAALLAGAMALVAAGPAVLPEAWTAWQLRAAAEDPADLAAIRLRRVATPERLGAEFDAALAAGDADLARSLVAVAEAEGMPVSAERRTALAAAEDEALRRGVADAARGFATGRGEGLPGLAGALAGDLVGYGDLRDLWTEGGKLLRQEPYDEVLLGLSAVGLALTGVTVASFGTGAAASVPAHAGATALKLATRTGRLSKPLQATLARTTHGLVDSRAVGGALAALGRLDLTAAKTTVRAALRPGALRTLRGLGEEAAALQARIGTRGTLQALSVAESADDLRRAGRLSERLGPRSRAALALLGRSALVLGSVALTLLQALWLGAAWLFGAALLCRRLGTAIGRWIWPRPLPGRRRMESRDNDRQGAADTRRLRLRMQDHLGGWERRQAERAPDLERA